MVMNYIANISMFVLAILLFFWQHTTIYAKCPGNFRGDGSVIFYWKEIGEARTDQMRNWGLLEEQLEEDSYEELTDYFDPKYVYAYTVMGDCCWKIWNETKFKGPSEELEFGFRGIPKYPQFNVNSLKKVRC